MSRFWNHKFATRCSIVVRGKVPSTLQWHSPKLNEKRKKIQNHSQLIQTQDKWEKEKRKSRNKGAALNDSVIAPHVKWCYLTKRTLQGCLLRTGQCLITIFIDEPTAIIQKRMHTSGVISWYYIRSTLAIPQVVCTCTKCRLYSFRLSNIADVTNVTC